MSESLENFTNIVKEDIKEAKTLFFSEAFRTEKAGSLECSKDDLSGNDHES